MHKFLIVFSVTVVAVLSLTILSRTVEAPATVLPVSFGNLSSEDQPISLLFVGDLMFDRGVEQVWRQLPGGVMAMFEYLPWFAAADVIFGNLEGPVSDQGTDVGSIYSFRMDPVVLPVLRAAGFDVLSFSNNHVGDWGREAFDDTIIRAQSAGILLAGAGQNFSAAATPKIVSVKNKQIGFLAFSDVGPAWLAAADQESGIILASDPRLPEIIKSAATTVDWLIVSFHWGEEYETEPSLRQQELADLAKANGARIVIGHHPHVIQEVDFSGEQVTAYSLGNFIFDQYFSPDTMKGLVLEVVLRDDKIEAVREKIVTLNKNFQPSL